MKITAYKTPIIKAGEDLHHHIAQAVPWLPENSFLAVTSKIVSTCENRLVEKLLDTKEEKHQLVKQEADFFTNATDSQYNMMLTIKRNLMFVNAGIDESNADNHYILWPADPQQSINQVWQWARNHYQIKNLGVIMTDSTSMPLNWGVFGRTIAYCGFWPLKSYIGKPDLYGRIMKMEQLNIAQCLASAAVLEMGEGDESTPLAVIEDVIDVDFQDHVPTATELAKLKIDIKDDAYAPIITKGDWHPGGGGK